MASAIEDAVSKLVGPTPKSMPPAVLESTAVRTWSPMVRVAASAPPVRVVPDRPIRLESVERVTSFPSEPATSAVRATLPAVATASRMPQPPMVPSLIAVAILAPTTAGSADVPSNWSAAVGAPATEVTTYPAMAKVSPTVTDPVTVRVPVAARRMSGVPTAVMLAEARVVGVAGPVLISEGSSQRRSVSVPVNADMAVPFMGGHGN